MSQPYKVHSLPEMDESGVYECMIKPRDLVVTFQLYIDRGWREYRHSNPHTPREDVCIYEDIDVEVQHVLDENGDEVQLCQTEVNNIIKQIEDRVPRYKDFS